MNPCRKCKQIKPLSEMARHRGNPNGLHGWCKPCKRESNNASNRANRDRQREQGLKHKYGLSLKDVEKMKVSQGGLCAICKSEPTLLCVDHCHATGKVRGLLCKPCNTRLFPLDAWEHRHAAERYLQAAA